MDTQRPLDRKKQGTESIPIPLLLFSPAHSVQKHSLLGNLYSHTSSPSGLRQKGHQPSPRLQAPDRSSHGATRRAGRPEIRRSVRGARRFPIERAVGKPESTSTCQPWQFRDVESEGSQGIDPSPRADWPVPSAGRSLGSAGRALLSRERRLCGW